MVSGVSLRRVWLGTHVVCAVESEEGVRRKSLASSREGMAYLEERVNGEALVEFCAKTGEGEVVEEDSPLHLPIDLVHRPGVTEAKRCSSVVESLVCIEDGAEEAAGLRGRESDRRC